MCCETCGNWARQPVDLYGLKGEDGFPLVTNHHENCPHLNDSLIDVWKASDGTTSYYTDDAQMAREEVQECESEVTVTPMKMHREIMDALPEFDGF